ncbi:hypothetical protein ACJX0J_018274, partial [Zea mays]
LIKCPKQHDMSISCTNDLRAKDQHVCASLRWGAKKRREFSSLLPSKRRTTHTAWGGGGLISARADDGWRHYNMHAGRRTFLEEMNRQLEGGGGGGLAATTIVRKMVLSLFIQDKDIDGFYVQNMKMLMTLDSLTLYIKNVWRVYAHPFVISLGIFLGLVNGGLAESLIFTSLSQLSFIYYFLGSFVLLNSFLSFDHFVRGWLPSPTLVSLLRISRFLVLELPFQIPNFL